MFVRETTPDGSDATLTDHESVGGRFEQDGSFRGTYWKMTLESKPDGDEDESVDAKRGEPRAVRRRDRRAQANHRRRADASDA